MAMVTAANQMAGSAIRANSGITKTSDHVAPSTPTTGTPTKWVLVMANADPLATRISLMATPSRTAASGAGNSDLASGVLGQISNKAKQTKPTSAAPGNTDSIAVSMAVKVVSPSGCSNAISPTGSVS